MKALNDELRELRAARAAINGAEPSANVARAANPSRMTHRDMIVAALHDRPEGGTSDKVVEWVYQDFGVEISQSSISSQLSRAKADNLVTLDVATKIWRSEKSSAKENEPPKGGSEAEEVAPSSYPSGSLGMFTNASPAADPALHSDREGGD